MARSSTTRTVDAISRSSSFLARSSATTSSRSIPARTAPPRRRTFEAYPIRLEAPGEQYDIRLFRTNRGCWRGVGAQVRVPPIHRSPGCWSSRPRRCSSERWSIARRGQRVKRSRPAAG